VPTLEARRIWVRKVADRTIATTMRPSGVCAAPYTITGIDWESVGFRAVSRVADRSAGAFRPRFSGSPRLMWRNAAASDDSAQGGMVPAERYRGGLGTSVGAPRTGGQVVRILYHFRVRGRGVEAVHIAGISSAFRKLGHHVEFVSPMGVDPCAVVEHALERPVQPGLLKRTLQLVADHFPQPAFEAAEMAYNLWATPRLLSRLRHGSIDLVYERHAFFNVAGAVACQRAGVPLIVEVNELAGHERVRGQSFVGMARRAERFVLRRAALVVTVSDFLRERVRELTEGRTPVVTVPNGIDVQWAASAPSRELRSQLGIGSSPIVMFVGSLVHWHNFPLLVSAMATVRRTVPNAVLVFVGDGPHRDAILKEAERLGMGNAVRITGQVPHPEVRDWLAIADVAVIPFSNQYRSPVKLFEYMALGLPIAAPRTPPIESVLADGEEGLLFDPVPEELSSALVRLLTDRAHAMRLGNAARRKVFENFTWGHHADRILSVLGESEPRLRFKLHSRARPRSLPPRRSMPAVGRS
jgi:glycosyltransferase involved in cell wall biosynthesis